MVLLSLLLGNLMLSIQFGLNKLGVYPKGCLPSGPFGNNIMMYLKKVSSVVHMNSFGSRTRKNIRVYICLTNLTCLVFSCKVL